MRNESVRPWLMLHTSTEGKNTSERGTLPSSVVCTVAFQNSMVLSCRKKPPENTEVRTMRSQKVMRKVLRPRLSSALPGAAY